jgi:iron(III) transport system substrate-binding protein
MRTVVLALTAAALLLSGCRPSGPSATAPSQGAPAAPQAQGGPAAQPAATNDLSPEVRRLIQAARDNGETELSLSWGSTSMGGSEAIKRYEALMNQMYGTSFRIRLTPGPSMPDMGVKLTQEYLAGQKASSDIYLASDTTFSAVLPQDLLEPYDYTRLSPRVIRDIVAQGNVGVEVYGTIPAIVYNTELVRREEVPRRLEGVLDPRWRGKMAASVTASYFDRIATRPEWGAEKMKTFMTRLAEHVGGLIRQSEEHRIISGEFPIFVLGNTHSAREQAATGAPIAGVVPEDSAQIGTMHLGVPRNAAHPNLAKLYINAVVSEPGQRILYETYFSDHFQLPGSQSAAELTELQARGVEIRKVDVKFALDHPELADLSNEFRAILREKAR